MMSKIRTIVIGVVVLVAGFFAYNYYFVSDEDTSTGIKSVPKSEGENSPGTVSTSTKSASQNDLYLKQLIALRAITFTLDMFTDDAYKILRIEDTNLPFEEKGRRNPFAPLESGDGNFATGNSSSTGFQLVSTSTNPVLRNSR